MGGKFSSAGNSTGNETSDQPGTSDGVAVAELPELSSLATAISSSGAGARSRQPGTSRAADVRGRNNALSKNIRLPDGSSVVNGRQLLEVLAANGVSGQTVAPHSRPSNTSGSPAANDGVAVNRTPLTSMPMLIAFRDVKCPVCHKIIPSDDVECHLVMCLTKPRVIYNEEILTEDKDEECVICFEELKQDHVIARLPCLCIYHKSCIDRWFQVSRSCPEHPDGASS